MPEMQQRIFDAACVNRVCELDWKRCMLLEQVIAFYDPQQHSSLTFSYGHDLSVRSLSHAAHWLWVLGYPDQCLRRSEH